MYVFVCLCAQMSMNACIYTVCMYLRMCVFVHRSLVNVVSRGGGGYILHCVFLYYSSLFFLGQLSSNQYNPVLTTHSKCSVYMWKELISNDRLG